MFTIEEIQSIGIFTCAFFVVIVITAFVSNEFQMKEQARIYNRSRWFLVIALTLLTVHYVLQRVVGYRHMEGNQAALVNLIFYIPVDVFVHLSLLNLLCLGQMKRWYYSLGIGIVAISALALFGAGAFAEGGLMGNSKLLIAAEHTTSLLVAVTFLTYIYEELKLYRALNSEFDYYYDAPQQRFFRWFATCIALFVAVTLLTSIIIFTDNTIILSMHGAIAFTSIGFLVINFLHYGSDGSLMKTYSVLDASGVDADRSDNPDETAASYTPGKAIQQAVDRWLASGQHLRAGITAEEISAEMGISRDELKQYLKSQNHPKIGSWLAIHRIKEAQRLLLTHPEYSHDTIAEQCGFSSREYFQTCFRNTVGIPPMQWQKENHGTQH